MRTFTLLSLLLLLPACLLASTTKQQRNDFIAAETAWKQQDRETYNNKKSALNDYPLQVYLDYTELQERFSTATDKEIEAFIKRHGDTAPGQRMRARYLKKLAGQKKWKAFLNWFDTKYDTGIALLCMQLNAQINTGKGRQTYAQIEHVWLTASSRPKSCDPVMAYWKKKGKLTSDLVWQRIDLAIRHGKPKLANSLSGYLKKSDRKWLQRMIKLRTDPQATLSKLNGKHSFKGKMTGYGLARLAESKPEMAVQMHDKLVPGLPKKQRCDATSRLGKALARQDGNTVYTFFKESRLCPKHTDLHEARLKAALLREQWSDVISWYQKAPTAMRSETNWTYWHARALAQTGNQQKATALFRELAQDRSFYAYLSADRLGISYHWNHRPADTASDNLSKMRNNPTMQRIHELYELERDLDARREWNLLIKQHGKRDLIAAARLFDQWGIHDRAIFTISKASYWDDLEIRFPVKHKKLVFSYAKKQKIDPKWAFAILRQESAFMEDANSSAGARGLMQLMPKTARHVADQLNMKRPRKSDLMDPKTNIRLGTGYLAEMQDKFGNLALATAAYNAGPHRVNKWLYDRQLPGDIWVELIPFKETRRYARRVMTYASIYDRLLGGKRHTITERLGTTPTTSAVTTN